ncbi:MAG: PIN domain-containing protein [Gammaproteobacteria bacterium]
MKIIVDTSIWSLALRRKTSKSDVLTSILSELINESRVQMLGAIRQELLSGIKLDAHFKQLRDYLRAFADFSITEADHEQAAEYFNLCRKEGIQGSNTDFLICAVAVRHNMQIFTSDKDFALFSNILPVKLFPFEIIGPH